MLNCKTFQKTFIMISCILAASLQTNQKVLDNITRMENENIFLPNNYGEKTLLEKQNANSVNLQNKNRIKTFEKLGHSNRKKRQTATIPNTDQFVEEVIFPQSFHSIKDIREAIEVKGYKYEDINYATYLHTMINKVIPFMSNLNEIQIMHPNENELAEIHNCITLIKLRGQIALKEYENDGLLRRQFELSEKMEYAGEEEKASLAIRIGNINSRIKNIYDSIQKLRSDYNIYGLKQRAFKNKINK